MELNIYAESILKTVLAIVMSGVIGLERQARHRPAGFRTHILVCLGSMTIMILSEYMFVKYWELYGVAFDPTRMSAQVISGIGFLGAGTIIHYGTNVKGLTTAASLWAVAAIGLVIGTGFYFLAVVLTISIYATLFIFNRVSTKINDIGNILEILIHAVNKPKTLGEIHMVFSNFGAIILDMEFVEPSDSNFSETEKKITATRIIVKLPQEIKANDILTNIENIAGVAKVEKI